MRKGWFVWGNWKAFGKGELCSLRLRPMGRDARFERIGDARCWAFSAWIEELNRKKGPSVLIGGNYSVSISLIFAVFRNPIVIF